MIKLLIVLCLLLSGCASIKGLYDDEGKLTGVRAKGFIDGYVKQGDTEFKADTKFEPLKDVFNLGVLK